jgi:hypothetical protein
VLKPQRQTSMVMCRNTQSRLDERQLIGNWLAVIRRRPERRLGLRLVVGEDSARE